MNIVKKLSVFILAFLMIGGSVFGATVTLKPSTVPVGAYVNGSDGDQHYVQSRVFTWAVDDGWEDGDDITITLPTNMTIADVDEDGVYTDEVSMAWTTAGIDDPGFTVADVTNKVITVNTTTGANVVAGDKLTVFFPVETTDGLADGTQETYSFATVAATDVNEASFSTITVTYETDVLSFVTFAANYDGGDESSELGDVYPTAASAITAVLTDIVNDLDAGGGGEGFVNGANDWDGITLDNDNDGAAGGTLADAEVQFYVWASQDSSLLRVDEESGAHKPIVGTQPTRANAIAATGSAGDPIDSDVESGTFSTSQLNGKLLAEGTWYFYVTSSVTGDWVLGRSDSVAIRHWPVFDNSVAGYEAIVDYDGDGLFEYGVAANDDVTELYLESGGGVGIDGAWGGTNRDNASFHWNVKDVDDNANVKIFKSTTNGITDKATLLADANTTQISPDTLYEEGPTSVFWNYDIYTDANNFEDAGDFYIYFLADDGKNSNVFQLVDAADADFQLKVKHFPNLEFQDVSYLYDEDDLDVDIDFNTANQQYITFNWGETVDGDKDADGDMQIDLYISQLANAASGYDGNVASVNASILPTDASDNPTQTVHVATIIDNADGRDDNRYVYDLRNSGLVAGTYYMYGVISEQGDEQVIQMYSDGGAVDDRPIVLTHGTYFLAKSPPEGNYVNLKKTDRYTFKWDAFNKSAPANFVLGIFAVPQGTDISAYDGGEDFVADAFCLTSSDGNYANLSLVTATDKETMVDFGTMTADAAGNPLTPSGDYDIYYVYEDAEANITGGDLEDPVFVKADGPIHFETFADPATSFELSPNRFVAEKGDTISMDIYATDGAVENAMIVSVYMNVPTSKFSIVDQDNSTSGTQAWLDESVNFNGTEFINEARVNGDYYEIDYVEYADGGDALATSLKIGTIQLVATANYTGDALEGHEVTFSTTGDRTTSIIGASNNTLSVTVPEVAATVELATPGKISGHVDMEARSPEGETVEIYVVPEGSMNMISDSDFLSANGLSSATDTLTYTLGAGGYYEVLRIPSGTYDVFIHKDGFLDQRINSQAVQPLSTTNVDFEGDDKLLAGDCAGYTDVVGNNIPDNQIADEDEDAISTAFNSTPDDENWNAYADFDGDSLVFVSDLNWATKNSGSGEGLLYKKPVYNGSNEGAKYILARENDNRFSITANGLAHVRAYAATISFNPNDWELKDVNDGMGKYLGTFNFYSEDEGRVQFVSSIRGESALTNSDLELVEFGLNPRVDNPSMPELIDIAVVDANHSETKGFVDTRGVSNMPTEFTLEKNYPNPFNPTTNIKYAIPEAGNVKLVVYDLLGNKIRTLVSSNLTAGHYDAVWHARNDAGLRVSSGVYFYRLMVGNKIVDTKKMVLMK